MAISMDEFLNRNVLCCVSSLVSDVAKLVAGADRLTLRETSFDEDDLQALMECADWETPGLQKIREMDRDELVSELEDADVEDKRDKDEITDALTAFLIKVEDGDIGDDGAEFPGLICEALRTLLIAAIESDPNADDWETFGRHHDLDPEYQEVYEHWNVDPRFGARLKERGETVRDFGNLTVWGRTTTGQSISLDYVVCQIYDELHEHHQEQSA